MKLYLAAPLFSEAERAFNVALADALSAAGHEVDLPQRDTPTIEGSARTTGVFRANLAAISKADAVVAVCEGSQVDDGTAWEVGYAYGRKRADQPDDPGVAERALGLDPAAYPHAALCGDPATRKGLVPRAPHHRQATDRHARCVQSIRR